MRILVTGGAGFIGSALIRHLVLDLGHEVLNVDKLTYAGNPASLRAVDGNPLYTFLKADICDAKAIEAAINGFRPERIMHLAAESHVDRSIGGARDFVETNAIGTFVMLEAGRAYWERPDPGRSGQVSLSARLDRRGVRLARRNRRLFGIHALRSEFALFGIEGRVGPFRPRLGTHLWAAGRGLQLLQQLRPVPVPRKN